MAVTLEREPSGLIAILLPIIETADAAGVDVGGILSAHHLTRDDLKPEERLPLRVGTSIVAALEAAYDGPLGLRSATRYSFGRFGLVDHLLASAATLREALELINRFFPLFHEGIQTTLREEGDRAYSTHVFTSGATTPAIVEYARAMAVRRTWALIGTEHPVIEIRFTHQPRGALAEYTAFFRAPVVFGASDNETVISREFLDRPLPGASAIVCESLRALASGYEMSLTATRLVQRVRLCATAALEQGGDGALAEVARAIGMGPRTLQRRLVERGTTFDRVLDELRSELAPVFVANPVHPIGRVAKRLGFEDAGAFARAFRRWTSMSPSEFRATKPPPSSERPSHRDSRPEERSGALHGVDHEARVKDVDDGRRHRLVCA